MKRHYESADDDFPASAYTVRGYAGIAWYVLGWETEPDDDTEWSGCENRTGQVVAIMVGDDRHFSVQPDDLTPLTRAAYCGVCGQIGCAHDGMDRTTADDTLTALERVARYPDTEGS